MEVSLLLAIFVSSILNPCILFHLTILMITLAFDCCKNTISYFYRKAKEINVVIICLYFVPGSVKVAYIVAYSGIVDQWNRWIFPKNKSCKKVQLFSFKYWLLHCIRVTWHYWYILAISLFAVCGFRWTTGVRFHETQIICAPVEDNPTDYEVSDQHKKSTAMAYHRREQICHDNRGASQLSVQTNSISVSYCSTLHSFTIRKVFIGFSNYCLRLRSTLHRYIRYTVSSCVHTFVFVHTTNIWADVTCRSPCTHWVWFTNSSDHRWQPSRNRPAFWLISRISAFLRKRPAFLALFWNNKIGWKSQ